MIKKIRQILDTFILYHVHELLANKLNVLTIWVRIKKKEHVKFCHYLPMVLVLCCNRAWFILLFSMSLSSPLYAMPCSGGVGLKLLTQRTARDY